MDDAYRVAWIILKNSIRFAKMSNCRVVDTDSLLDMMDVALMDACMQDDVIVQMSKPIER